MHDEYKTIRSESRTETKVQGSRFIATATPITTKAEAEQFVGRIKKEFWDATHNCFAYRLGTDGREFRSNDDGEPSGSAGKPILAVIDKLELTDTAVVVTRYFGGTKLGVGGLIRSYSQAAEKALLLMEPITKYVIETFEATFPHSQISNVMHIVSRLGAKIVDTRYDEDVHLRLEIRRTRAGDLNSSLVNQTNGNIDLKNVGQ